MSTIILPCLPTPEPPARLELATYGLRYRCSTVELRRLRRWRAGLPTAPMLRSGLRQKRLRATSAKTKRDTRIELAPQPWEGRILPLY